MVSIVVRLQDLKEAIDYLEKGGVGTEDFIQILQSGKNEIQINEFAFDQGIILNSGLFIPTFGD